MPWKEVSPGKWERPLDSSEILLKLQADEFQSKNKEHWALNIHAVVRFDGTPQQEVVAALRLAWIQTRYHHPLIAAQLSGTNHVYQVPDATGVETWANETFIVDNKESAADFWLTSQLMDYPSLYYFSKTSELVMRIHHWLIDGMGGMNLLDRFLTYLSSETTIPSFGSEYVRLPPTHKESAGLPAKASPAAEAAAQDALVSYVSKFPSVGLPFLSGTAGGTRVFRLGSSSSTLSSLLAQTRKHELGFAAAVQAAVALATRERAPKAISKQPFLTTAFFNHRKYLQEPYNNSTKWPMSVWMMALPISQPEADFTTTAKNFQAMYGQDLTVGKNFATEWWDAFCFHFGEVLLMPLPDGMPLPSQPQLSSIGSLDGFIKARYEGKIAVEVMDVEPVVENMRPQVMVFQWSFAGKWYLNACYNENLYAEGEVEAFLKRTREILFKELGVEEVDAWC
ncbi:hypothetical protein FQN50_002798 [Emmonsiellopsis sp. PD_5]|nr:hypothetical protein FQN50_002798 [Emmonsiellopsis sp. PD_5]